MHPAAGLGIYQEAQGRGGTVGGTVPKETQDRDDNHNCHAKEGGCLMKDDSGAREAERAWEPKASAQSCQTLWGQGLSF